MEPNDNSREAVKLISEISKMLKQCMRKSFQNSDITMPQSIVLHCLQQHGPMKISNVSEKVHLSNSTVSGIIDRLEKNGLVERTRNEEDRRTVYVNVTKKFLEEHIGIHKQAEESFLKLIDSGTSEEIDKVVEGLNALKNILNDRKDI